MREDEYKWANLEEQLDKAICELTFDACGGTPSLAVLVGLFRTPGALPEAVREHAAALTSVVGEHAGDAVRLSEEGRTALSSEIVAMLRFVCHRGDES